MDRGSAFCLVLKRVQECPLAFVDYEPRSAGFSSDIAQVLGCDPSQNSVLLDVIADLEEDHHFEIRRLTLREAITGKKFYPAKIRVEVLQG